MNWMLRKAIGAVFSEGEGGGAAGGGAAAALGGGGDGAGGGQGGSPNGGAGGGSSSNGEAGKGTWYESFKDPEVKTWIASQNNAYPDAESMATKALNLEKFVGLEKSGRGVVIPKSDAKPEEWKAFWTKVGGVPEKADGYKLPDGLDANLSAALSADPMFGKFREMAHSISLPPAFFGPVMKWYADTMKEQVGLQLGDYAKNVEKEMGEVRKEWGKDFDANLELGRRAAKQFIPHKDAEELATALTKIENALGSAQMLKLFHNIGKTMGEDDYVEQSGGAGGYGMSKEAALQQIQTLSKDQEFGKKLASGDAAAKLQWDNLHKIAYPGQKSL